MLRVVHIISPAHVAESLAKARQTAGKPAEALGIRRAQVKGEPARSLSSFCYCLAGLRCIVLGTGRPDLRPCPRRGRSCSMGLEGGDDMKLVTGVVKPDKLDAAASAVSTAGARGMTAMEVHGFGQQFGHLGPERPEAAAVLPKLRRLLRPSAPAPSATERSGSARSRARCGSGPRSATGPRCEVITMTTRPGRPRSTISVSTWRSATRRGSSAARIPSPQWTTPPRRRVSSALTCSRSAFPAGEAIRRAVRAPGILRSAAGDRRGGQVGQPRAVAGLRRGWLLDEARQSTEAGATGLIFGRNISQRGHDDSLHFVGPLREIAAKCPS